jgi:protein-S-isoprenylcysteine O-methyltransferase Ste14
VAATAIAGLALYAAVTVGWRMWLQHRRTGDAGFRAVSGNAIDRASSLLITLAAVAITLAPVAMLSGKLHAVSLMTQRPIQFLGIALFVAAFVLTVRAQLDMGNAWRIGVDRSEDTSLVTTGTFQLVRNPIFSGVFLAFLGVALMVPNGLALAALVLLLVGLELHVRLVEEPYLQRVHGDRYRQYASRVGRFIPKIGLTAGSPLA